MHAYQINTVNTELLIFFSPAKPYNITLYKFKMAAIIT